MAINWPCVPGFRPKPNTTSTGNSSQDAGAQANRVRPAGPVSAASRPELQSQRAAGWSRSAPLSAAVDRPLLPVDGLKGAHEHQKPGRAREPPQWALGALLGHGGVSGGVLTTGGPGMLTGDELIPEADRTATRAISIRRRAAVVGPWIAQLGQGTEVPLTVALAEPGRRACDARGSPDWTDAAAVRVHVVVHPARGSGRFDAVAGPQAQLQPLVGTAGRRGGGAAEPPDEPEDAAGIRDKAERTPLFPPGWSARSRSCSGTPTARHARGVSLQQRSSPPQRWRSEASATSPGTQLSSPEGGMARSGRAHATGVPSVRGTESTDHTHRRAPLRSTWHSRPA